LGFGIAGSENRSKANPPSTYYGQELVPGKVGMIGGVFYGFAFGMGGLGSALLGWLADLTSISFVYHVCSFLPLIGILTIFLPNLDRWVPNKGR
jgi:FSR family fosmidomycin resistance protein-like MFS transporter